MDSKELCVSESVVFMTKTVFQPKSNWQMITTHTDLHCSTVFHFSIPIVALSLEQCVYLGQCWGKAPRTEQVSAEVLLFSLRNISVKVSWSRLEWMSLEWIEVRTTHWVSFWMPFESFMKCENACRDQALKNDYKMNVCFKLAVPPSLLLNKLAVLHNKLREKTL